VIALLEPQAVERLRDIIAERTGLQFADDRLEPLAEIFRTRMAALGGPTPEAYARRLASADRQEIRVVARSITVAETYFFRYWDHFRAFSEVVIPERLAIRPSLRVLSAGCASGEEPYSLAVMIREHVPHLDSIELSLSGIDINSDALERAVRARYSAWSLRETSVNLRERYFDESGREFRLADSVRSMVAFEERNVAEDSEAFWRRDRFDVIFFRNVMIYFSAEAMAAAVARMTRSLAPGGFLFLGHAETLRGISHDYHLRHTHQTFYYQRRDGSPSRVVEVGLHKAERGEGDSVAKALELTDTSWVSTIERATEQIKRLSGRSPDSPEPVAPPVEVPPSIGPDLTAALELLRQERFVEALDLLPRPPDGADPDLDTELLRAVLLVNRGLLADAEAVCRTILKDGDLNAGAHYLTALCREHAGDRDGAVEHDRTAAYLDPSFAMPHLHLGLLLRRIGEPKRAGEELDRALTLLAYEDPSRILLFGGGFRREALVDICRSAIGSGPRTS
jgi:chemotaxis protein methyltransferase CheR